MHETQTRQLTRAQAIDDLRETLLALADDGQSICEVAERLQIFCGGFAQWSFLELKERYPQLVRSRKKLTPAQLKDLANRWQLARQFVKDTRTACDTQLTEGDQRTCAGWDEWDDEHIAEYYAQLRGETVEIVPRAPEP